MPKKFGKDRMYVVVHSSYGYPAGVEVYYYEFLARKRFQELIESDDYDLSIDRIKLFSVLPGTRGIHLHKGGCPLDGDINDDCADCVYAGDYYYNKETKECVPK